MIDASQEPRPTSASHRAAAPILGYASRSTVVRRRFSFAVLGVILGLVSALIGMLFGGGKDDAVSFFAIIGVLAGTACYCVARIASRRSRNLWMKFAMLMVVAAGMFTLLATLNHELKEYPPRQAVVMWYRYTSQLELWLLCGSVVAFAALRFIDWRMSRRRLWREADF